MSSSLKSCFLYLFGSFLLLFSGVQTKPTLIDPQNQIQERSTRNPIYTDSFEVRIREVYEKNFTGFRSAFQWSIGETFDISTIHNFMEFSVNESLNENTQLFGQIGIYSNGSQIGVHFSFESVASSSPGPSFTCTNDLPFFTESHACVNSNYTLISNAIYFLDVEIRGRTIRGYISEPQKDFTDMDDPYLPRNLIGDLKWHSELEDLRPTGYWTTNKYESCESLSEIMTFNSAPELYNKRKREKVRYRSSHQYVDGRVCGPKNILRVVDFYENIVSYISRPTPEIIETRSTMSLRQMNPFF